MDHVEIEISINRIENAIRPFIVGCKGWQFFDTLDDAKASPIAYSLMETARVNRLWPEDYIEYLLTVQPERFTADSDIDDLLPLGDKFSLGG